MYSPEVFSSFPVPYFWLSRSIPRRLKAEHVGWKEAYGPSLQSLNHTLKERPAGEKRRWRWHHQESYKLDITEQHPFLSLALSLLPTKTQVCPCIHLTKSCPFHFQNISHSVTYLRSNHLNLDCLIHSPSQFTSYILGFVRGTNLGGQGSLKDILGSWWYPHFNYLLTGLLASFLTTVIHLVWEAIIIFLLKEKKKHWTSWSSQNSMHIQMSMHLLSPFD